MLSPADLDAYFDQHATRTAFRLETLDAYDVPSDGSDFQRYLAGEPGPDPTRERPWLDHLRTESDRGLHRTRVHLLRRPLSPYLRYECEWCDRRTVQAGEDVRIVDLTGRPTPGRLRVGDFWLLNDEHLLLMRYDEQGRFLGADIGELGQLPAYQLARDIALEMAEPFTSWWPAHPEEWRENWAA